MNKHTPGPWVAPDPRSDYEGRVFDRSIMAAVSNGNPIPIARAYNNIGTNCEANARLIAAAPDLLAALEEAERALRWAAQESKGRVKAEIVGGWLHHADAARAAIAKARGEE